MKKSYLKLGNGLAPRMPARRTRFGAACYKSDAEVVQDAVDHLEEKMKEFKNDLGASTMKEIKAVKEAAEKEKKELTEKVNLLNETIAEKDGTIEDIQQAVKELKMKGGRSGFSSAANGLRASIAGSIAQAIGECKEDIIQSASGHLMKPHEIKAADVILTANLTTDKFISYLDWRPGMEPTGQFHFRNLVRTLLSETDYVQFPRAASPIGEGSFDRQSEGAAKQQVDRDYAMVNLTLTPMAAYSVASRQSLRNILFLQSWLPESLMNQMEEAEDTDFSGILVAAATGSTSTSGFTSPNIADKLIIYLKTLIASKYNPNAIAADPDVWAKVIMLRPGTAGESYSGPPVVVVDQNGVIRVLGRPLYPVNWLTGGRVVVGDWTKAAIVQSEGLRLRQSDSHASLFTSNEICFLLERTEGLAIFRPNAFITTTL